MDESAWMYFEVAGTGDSFIPSIFSPFEPECLYLSHAYPTIVLGEQVLIICFSSFTDSQMEMNCAGWLPRTSSITDEI